jgi:hypothetical protein
MTTPSRAPSPRVSGVLLAVVALALLVGAAASLVAGAATAGSYQPGPIQDVYLTGATLGYMFLAAFLIVVGILVWIWIDQRKSTPGRFAIGALMIVLAMLLALALLHTGSSGPSTSGVPVRTSGGNNTTGGGTTTNNSTGPPSTGGGTLGFGGVHLPSWTLFAVAAAAGLVTAALLAPALWRRVQDPIARRRAAQFAEVERARGALRTAAWDLREGRDPREVIIRLYGALLERVAPIVGGVDRDTPEEIRTTHLVALGIRPEPAATLTRLFEEARYSSHPIGPESSALATDAIALARADLDRLKPEL